MGTKAGLQLLLALLVLGFISTTSAIASVVTVEFLPSPAVAGKPVAARLSSSAGVICWPDPDSVVRNGSKITLTVSFSDACISEDLLLYRDYDLGSLSAGNYTFVYQACHDEPPPQPSSCDTVLQTQLIVAAPPPPPTVPTLSMKSLFAMAFGMILSVGCWYKRNRRLTA